MSFSPDNPYSSPPPGGPDSPDHNYAASKVKGPAIGMLVVAPIGIIGSLIDLIFRIINIQTGNVPVLGDGPGAEQGAVIGAYAGGGLDVVSIICQVLVIYGALQLMKLESRSAAMTASVISVIPCISACCILGMPFGIWALVVMNDPTVRAAFKS